jgi:hypothetical protein
LSRWRGPETATAQIYVNPQNNQQVPPRPKKEISLSGPRFGLTMLSPGNVAALAEKEIFLQRSTVSQFGWQFEKRLYTNDDGLSALTEFVPLISGLEQGVALPSLNWLVGIRTSTGTEFGIGPNITPSGWDLCSRPVSPCDPARSTFRSTWRWPRASRARGSAS